MDGAVRTKKCMSKGEIALLIELIQSNPVLTSKETNAITNKIKEDTWNILTCTFNDRSGSIPRTTEQLKMKWDNLKKATRKRIQQITMSKLKSRCGKPEGIPMDEILDKVSEILASTSNETEENSVQYEALAVPYDDIVEVLVETPSNGMQSAKRKIIHSENEFDTIPKQLTRKKVKTRLDDDGRRTRNLAVARYFAKKTEKLEIEIKMLKLEYERKVNGNFNE